MQPLSASALSFHRFQPIFLIFHVHNDELIDSFHAFLQRCFTLQQSRQLHSQLVLTSVHRLPFLAARLIAIYARFVFLSHARKVFDAIPLESLHHLLLWNSIIRANVSHGYHQHALELYVEMRKLGFLPDGFTLPLVIRSFSSLGSSYLCRIVHCHTWQMGFRNHLHVVNELVGMYGKLGRMEHACQLFDEMFVRSIVSWNTMVSGYALNRDSLGASRKSILWNTMVSSIVSNNISCFFTNSNLEVKNNKQFHAVIKYL